MSALVRRNQEEGPLCIPGLGENKHRPRKYRYGQEGFLRCQTPTSAVRLEVEGCRVKNGGWRIESEEWSL